MQQWIAGKKQTGKSTHLLNCALEDIYQNKGIVWFGSEEILSYIPAKHRERTILFDPADTEYPIGFNPIVTADSFVETTKGLHAMDISAPNLTLFLTAAILSIEEKTIPNIPRMLLDAKFRKKQVITNKSLIEFWEWYDNLSDKDKNAVTSSTLNKVYQFLIDNQMRNIVGQPTSFPESHDLQDIKDKILIVPLKRTDKMSLLGSLVLSAIHHTGYEGTYYLDNGHRFAPRVVMDLIEDDANLYFANHYLDQLDDALRDCLIGMITNVVAFRLGVTDAEVLRKEFAIQDSEIVGLYDALENLKPYHAHIMMPAGMLPEQLMHLTDRPVCPASPCMIRDNSRIRYATVRAKVEEILDV